eukprot:3219961-Pyramimonas_sp.AAC.1
MARQSSSTSPLPSSGVTIFTSCLASAGVSRPSLSASVAANRSTAVVTRLLTWMAPRSCEKGAEGGNNNKLHV